MPSSVALSCLAAVSGFSAAAIAQTPPASTPVTKYDGTYAFVSSAKGNATYVARTGRMGQCREPGAWHSLVIVSGRARLLRYEGTVGSQGELAMRAASEPAKYGGMTIERAITGKIDSDGMVHAQLITNNCNYDLVWQKVPK
jgi:hypothetical protein